MQSFALSPQPQRLNILKVTVTPLSFISPTGHSERRTLFGETSEIVAKKTKVFFQDILRAKEIFPFVPDTPP
jgi:hypothetical protein